jgi:hypothetical protein
MKHYYVCQGTWAEIQGHQFSSANTSLCLKLLHSQGAVMAGSAQVTWHDRRETGVHLVAGPKFIPRAGLLQIAPFSPEYQA